ncbi:MAG: hypothetical protein ABI442_03865 [Gemmatimonadaceae bacterium]
MSAALLFKTVGVNPHGPASTPFMIATAVYGMAFASVGGLATAKISRARPYLHTGLLASLIALGAVVSLATSPSTDATWSQWMAILLMAPSALLGARLGGRASLNSPHVRYELHDDKQPSSDFHSTIRNRRVAALS